MVKDTSVTLVRMDKWTWNQRIDYAIDAAGITATELARRINTSSATITHWRNGRTKAIDAGLLLNAARELKTSPRWIMFGEGEPPGEQADGRVFYESEPITAKPRLSAPTSGLSAPAPARSLTLDNLLRDASPSELLQLIADIALHLKDKSGR